MKEDFSDFLDSLDDPECEIDKIKSLDIHTDSDSRAKEYAIEAYRLAVSQNRKDLKKFYRWLEQQQKE